MSLTSSEARTAAECAKKYPCDCGDTFLSTDVGERRRHDNAFVVANYLATHPDAVKFGWPAVAVAAVRGQLDGDGIWKALIDVCMAVQLHPGEYCEELGEEPLYIAGALEEYVRNNKN